MPRCGRRRGTVEAAVGKVTGAGTSSLSRREPLSAMGGILILQYIYDRIFLQKRAHG